MQASEVDRWAKFASFAIGAFGMKIILSRKGFDSSSGGGPSPIVDGRCLSLPIPEVRGVWRANL